MLSILLFIIGGIFGSFYNVCIYRLPNDLDIVSKNSFCIKCKYKIPFYLNIPIVSYIFNLGRCRNCKNKISISYLIVELFTAILFVYSYRLYGLNFEFIGYKNPGIEIAKSRYRAQHAENDCNDDLGSDSDN